MKKLVIRALAIAPWLMIAIPSAYAAGSAEARFQVSLVVVASCRIDTDGEGLDFGTVQTGRVASRQARAGLDVYCTQGQPYSIGFDNGLHGDGGMRHLAAGGAMVAYRLYAGGTPAPPSGPAGSAAALHGVGNGAPQHIPVTGRIDTQTITTPGHYSDTVRVTVTW